MSVLKIFVSHSSTYADLARSFKLSLHALETTTVLDIKISEEMAGATDWRRWIDDNVRTADVFLLLYPHASMEMGWCNYELGRFYDEKRPVICIKNTDIRKPPPAFEPYQAYNADTAGIEKFLTELFVSGAFSGGQPLNPAVGLVTDSLFKRAKDVASTLAQMFAEARVQQQLYENNISISFRYKGKELDRSASPIEGNDEGLRLLGLDKAANISWSTVLDSLGPKVDWPSELERALPSMASGSLPPTLSPFRRAGGMFIPVVARTESVDGVMQKLNVMFVEASTARLAPLLDWSLPQCIPDSLAFLIRILRMIFRARWEILQPRFQEATYNSPSPERCTEIVRSILSEYNQMQTFAEQEGMSGLDKFYAAFGRELRTEVNAYGDEWVELIDGLRTAAPTDAHKLANHLKLLLDNNTKWLLVCTRQFSSAVEDLEEPARGPLSASRSRPTNT
jgi:TIR domain-containing protein